MTDLACHNAVQEEYYVAASLTLRHNNGEQERRQQQHSLPSEPHLRRCSSWLPRRLPGMPEAEKKQRLGFGCGGWEALHAVCTSTNLVQAGLGHGIGRIDTQCSVNLTSPTIDCRLARQLENHTKPQPEYLVRSRNTSPSR